MKYNNIKFIVISACLATFATTVLADDRTRMTAAQGRFVACINRYIALAKARRAPPERAWLLIRGACPREEGDFRTASVSFLAPEELIREFAPETLASRTAYAEKEASAAIIKIKEVAVSAYTSWFLK